MTCKLEDPQIGKERTEAQFAIFAESGNP